MLVVALDVAEVLQPSGLLVVARVIVARVEALEVDTTPPFCQRLETVSAESAQRAVDIRRPHHVQLTLSPTGDSSVPNMQPWVVASCFFARV